MNLVTRNRKTLRKWYRTHVETRVLFEPYTQSSKYSLEQKKDSVECYLKHGRNLSRTIRALGYPSEDTLRAWCNELLPDYHSKRVGSISITPKQKKEAVLELCTRTGTAKDIAKKYGITRVTLYNWKNNLLPGGADKTVASKNDKLLPNDKDTLLSEIEALKRQINKLKLEKDILERTVEIIKKDPGVDPKNLTNKEKTILVDALRNQYPLKELLHCLGLARSSYFYHRKIASLPSKYERLEHRIIELFKNNSGRYGYRRIHALLAREGTRVSEKVVRRIMSECGLVVVLKKT